MSVTIESTSDTPEQIQAAVGGSKEKPAPENNSAPESNDTGENSDDSDSSETTEKLDVSKEDADGEEQADGSKKKPDDDAKVPKGVKRKIDKLTAKVSREREEKEYWKAEAIRTQNARPQTQETQKNDQVQPLPDGRPDADKFDSHAEYVEALTDWKLEQKLADRDSKAKLDETQNEFQSKLSSHREKSKSFAEKTPDFVDVIEDVEDIVLSPAVQTAILENGPEFMYQLAKNRAELERINALSPMAAARELGKFEERHAQQETPKTAVTKTKAPPPLQPVGNSRASGSSRNPSEMSYREFKQWRETNS